MTQSNDESKVNRREFLRRSSSLAAGAAVLGTIAPLSYAGEVNTIRLALIGCGGRGNGAVGDALNVRDSGPVKLHALADLDRKKIDSSQEALEKRFGQRANVSEECKFVGFDAYRRAIDILKPGDIAGAMGFIDGKKHSATLRAVKDAHVLKLQRDELEGMLEEHPRLVYKIMKMIVKSVHKTLVRMNRQFVEMNNYIMKEHGRY